MKAKASKIQVHARGTGGGSPAKPLTIFEERILAVCSLESVTGDNSLLEAGCSQGNVFAPVTSIQEIQPEDTFEIEFMEFADENAMVTRFYNARLFS